MAGIYRSIKTNISVFLDKLGTVLDMVSNKYQNVILVRDININTMIDSDDIGLTELVKLLDKYKLKYLLGFSTRITKNNKLQLIW